MEDFVIKIEDQIDSDFPYIETLVLMIVFIYHS